MVDIGRQEKDLDATYRVVFNCPGVEGEGQHKTLPRLITMSQLDVIKETGMVCQIHHQEMSVDRLTPQVTQDN